MDNMDKLDKLWIRESNLIENIDSEIEDERCYKAWTALLCKPFSISTILWLHKQIMIKLRPDIAGKFRQVNVRVGNYIAPSWTNVYTYISQWVEFYIPKYSEKCIEDYEEFIIDSHIRFEKIHPFEDGNGRTGRMLMNWQLIKIGLKPIIILNKDKQKYYKWFKQ